MTWSDEIAKSAQRWAEALRDNQCAFDHDHNTRYGENLSYFSPVGSGDVEKVLDGWYGEVAQYDFSRPGFSPTTGHFTQVVWKGSTELGCGMAECRNAELWVCRYNPPGNFSRRYQANVLPKSCK